MIEFIFIANFLYFGEEFIFEFIFDLGDSFIGIFFEIEFILLKSIEEGLTHLIYFAHVE